MITVIAIQLDNERVQIDYKGGRIQKPETTMVVRKTKGQKEPESLRKYYYGKSTVDLMLSSRHRALLATLLLGWRPSMNYR